jgi:hypothetical protein
MDRLFCCLMLVCAMLAGCGGANIMTYKNPHWDGYTDKIAIVPLVIASAPDDPLSRSKSPRWIAKTGGKEVPEAEYQAAQAAMVQQLRLAVGERELVLPEEVDRVMSKNQDGPAMDPGKAAAIATKKTKSHTGLVFSLSDYRTIASGARARNGEEGPLVTGSVHVAMFGPQGKTIWSLDAELQLEGDSAPPTVKEFVAYAAEAFRPAIEQSMEGL